jgi:uncharacterized membrane protein
MKLFQRITSGTVLFLNVLLIFFLFFQDRLHFPAWLQSVGRMHPLLLHLPIGALVIALVLVFFRNDFKSESFTKITDLIFAIAALSAALSALMGFILSKEGGYDEASLNYHLIAGISVSILTWILLLINTERKWLFNSLIAVSFMAIVVAGHFGATLTHGENFVTAPLMKSEQTVTVITDSTSLYRAAIEPIFKSKCMSCHNEQKKKGNLLMTSVESILAGGKHGPIWKAGDSENSTIIQRIHLPEDHEDHMPPAGKTPLTEKEKQLLIRWIVQGANVTTAWTKFAKSDTLMLLAKEFISPPKQPEAEPTYSFSSASQETIKKLNTPYRTVTPLAAKSPALSVEFFLGNSFKSDLLRELEPIKDQIVNLTLSGMPIVDSDGKLISEFVNIEKLNLNKTKVTGAVLTSLKDLKKLKSLSIAGTATDVASLQAISGLPHLKEVFLWNTQVTQEQIASLQSKHSAIYWNFGYQTNEVMRLTPPILLNDSAIIKNNEGIRLKHNLPGTLIRYTLDGTTPDSVKSDIYQDPISIDTYTTLKAIACRNGWLASAVTENRFFKIGHKPTSANLLTAPDKAYKGEGSKTLIDAKKGMADSFKDPAWLGYKDNPFEALFYFEKETTIANVTVSYGTNYYSHLLPPESVELWAGESKDNMHFIKKITPDQPSKNEPVQVIGIAFTLPKQSFHYFKISAKPISKIPEFVSKKREKGWFFIDEVIFN